MAAPPALRIARLGAAGDGIAEAEDGTQVFIPCTLPGEIVRARPTGRRGGGAVAVAEAIETASPDRVAPICPHFGACGGCALQHWAEAPYLAWKSDLLRAALIRAGYPEPTLAPIRPARAGTRRRMDLALIRDRGGIAVGLHPAHGGRPVDLAVCPVLDPALAALIAPLRALAAGAGWLRRAGSAIANLLDTGPDLLLRSDAAPGAAERMGLVAFARRHGIARLSWARGAEPAETVAELRPPRIAFGPAEIAPPPGAFLQATRDGEAAIRAAVLDALPADLVPRARIEELHAGLGTLSFALAARARVRAWDADAAALAALAEAAGRAGLGGRIETVARDLARRPLTEAELAGAAALVLDPPHGGAAEQMGALAATGPPTLIYVGCNPATLARDAAVLRAGGYALERAVPIDQFLFSARLEAVAVFRRARGKRRAIGGG